MKAKKTIAAPDMMPETPFGANGCQLTGFT